MPEPVQIVVTVDSNGAVTGFQQISAAGDAMGSKAVTASEAASTALANQSKATLTGAAAVAVLTAEWEANQKMIAEANARMKENMAAMQATAASAKTLQSTVKFQDWAPMVKNSSTAFMGMTSEQMKANVAGRLLEQTFGLQNRALNQVAARSSVLGPLMSAALPIGIAAAFLPMIIHIGEGIANAAQAAGGMTEAMKKFNEETIQASQQAFTNPKSMDAAREHLSMVNLEIQGNDKLKDSLTARLQKIHEEATFTDQLLGIETYRQLKEVLHNSSIDKGIDLEKQRLELLQKQADLIKQAGVDQAATAAESSGLHGFSKLNFDEAAAIKQIQDDKSLDDTQRESKQYAVHYEFSQKRIQLEQSETDKTIALRNQVVDETLHGTAKILFDEQASIDALTRAQQRSGGDYAEFQQQKVLLHQKALNQISALNNAADEHVKQLQEQAVIDTLTGDDRIRAEGQKLKDAEGRRYAEGLENDKQYNAAIVAIDAATNAKIQAADQKTTDKHAEELAKTVEMQQRADEDMKTAQEDAALAGVPEWQRASAQIQIELNRRERAIEDQKLKELAAEHLTQDQIVAINQDADAKRIDAMVQANMRMQEENKRMTEQLGSDLQSVFDDVTSGNIGKRILANMEKLFFQIVAQWILSLNVMKSAAGSIFGSIIFGPGSTGAGVFGGGGGTSILGSLFGGRSGVSSAPSGAAFQPGGIFSDPSAFAGGGLSSAIAGTSATSSGALVPSASNALTTATMADAVSQIGGGASSVAGSAGKASGISSLFSAGNLASLGGLGLATVGSAFGGKTGQAGGLLLGLLMSGKLSGVLSSLYGTGLGLAGTGALAGGLTGGLLGFGIGQNSGGVLGSLAGAGSGALTGFMVGGPVGAIVGGIVGLLGGIFGGIFGGSKRKKQANALADNTLLPDIAQISSGFDGFQIDSSSAIQQLEQLRTDSQKQLDALKSQGHDVFNKKVNPAIDAAESHIRDTQAERDRRGALNFGPPQFDTGGIFRTYGGRHGVAILEDGETVIKPGPSRNNKETLAAINAGKAVGSNIEIHLHPDTFDRAYVNSREFETDITRALTRASAEGRWG